MRDQPPTAQIATATIAAGIAGWMAAHWTSPSGTFHTAPVVAVASAVLLLGVILSRRAAADCARKAELRLENARAEGKRLCLDLAGSLACIIEAKAGYDLGHVVRVQVYCSEICKELHTDEDTEQAVSAAALMHEIGRLGISHTLLVKRADLTPEEWERIQEYPLLGSRILEAIPFPWPVAQIVRHHKERLDGNGYPDGLRGEEIPFGARILAVADAYDAMVSPRAYRPKRTSEEALEQIRQGAGSAFDPTIVEAFLKAIDRVQTRLVSAGSWILPSAPSEVADAAREVHALQELAASVSAKLSLADTLSALSLHLRELVRYSTCIVYLREGDLLRAYGAYGVNAAHFEQSAARMGTYLTGRVASRGEPALASYLEGDVMLASTPEAWTPLRSTLVVPLRIDHRIIGTLNLYHTEPDAFSQDDLRIAALVGELAARGIENARIFEKTRESAFTDPITGLRNARYLRHCLDQELNRARKNGHNLAVLGIDLDRFKSVNDTFGHERGDEVLRDLGALFEQHLRNYDVVARYAGDEFVIVLPETNRSEARSVVQKIESAVQSYAAGIQQTEPDFPPLGVSIGIAVFPEDGDTAKDLLAAADQEMYQCKRGQRAA
ncbi:MAG: bifunctional diguanylate cyclase/phosphohydrolase [Chthonomonadales bacterium]